MGHRLVATAGAALVIAGGLSGCAEEQTQPQLSARVTVGNNTHTIHAPRCSQLEGYRTVDIADHDSDVEAVVLLSGSRVIPEWVKIHDFAGFTGSFYQGQGGVGDAEASLGQNALTITGSAYGIHSQSPQCDHDSGLQDHGQMLKQRLHWFALHGFVRGLASIGVRRGDLQARLIADPAVKVDPLGFFDEVRARGPLVRCRVSYVTADYPTAHELLRSDDFRVIELGSKLPAPLRWLEDRTRGDLLHPLRPPSLLAVEPPDHTRYRKTVSSIFTTRAVTTLRDRVDQTAAALLDQLAGEPGVVDIVERYCAQLPVAIISDILGVPDDARHRVLDFGELAAPSLDVGLSWPQYRRVQRGLAGFNFWLAGHLQHLRSTPGDDLMSQLIQASDSGDPAARLDENELRGVAGLVLAAGFETTVNLLGNGIRILLDHPSTIARTA